MTARPAVVVLALAALGVAGCGKTIKAGDLEDTIAGDLQQKLGERPKVDCPGGQKAKQGHRFNCTIRLPGGRAATAAVTLTNDSGRFTYTVLAPSGK